MLTERQIQLLRAIINDYLETSEPVGSVEIVSKYNLKCSAATVRNEMAKLIDQGFLEMLHTSSGRVPTKMAYRMYLEEMMEESDLPVLTEVAMKQKLWGNRFEFEKLLRETANSLAEHTKYMAMAITTEGYITTSGAVNLLDHKEFWDIDATKAALLLTDNASLLEKVFQNSPYGGDVRSVIEEEIGMEKLNKCAIVFSPFVAGVKNGYIGVLGPSRMHYASIIPAVRYAKQLVEELSGF